MVFDGQISLEKGKKYVIPGEPFSQMPEHSGAVRCRRQWCYLKLPTSFRPNITSSKAARVPYAVSPEQTHLYTGVKPGKLQDRSPSSAALVYMQAVAGLGMA